MGRPYGGDTVGARRSSPLDQLVLGALSSTGRVTADELAARLASHRLGVVDSLERLRKRGLVRRVSAPITRRTWGQPHDPALWEAATSE